MTLLISAYVIVRASDPTASAFLQQLTTLVVGFYFGRTNHQRTGGVGGDQQQAGR